MSPTTDDLLLRVPPPAAPIDARGDWAAVEAALGCGLPADFKILIERYGRGEFGSLAYAYSPFGDGGPSIVDEASVVDIEAEERAEFPSDYRYPLFPEPGGLLVWGGTSNGDRLCWLTEGPPDEWPVIVWTPRGAFYERHDGGAAAYLLTAVDPWFDQPADLDHVYVRLTDGRLGYDERLRILREALAPTADRGGFRDEDTRQDHFVATDLGWRLTYETAYGHQIRVAYPPEDVVRARETILRTASAMGCHVLSSRRIDGTAVWV
ncbi:SMI1/KNR4 family protein [Actinoplanes sp. NPDC051633]|uniref:SMI1/KNR4 family protein n=1 Tax=Actinoplanes sp. NPDC051633 TaxID=3155670 RepID=UPI00343E7AB4